MTTNNKPRILVFSGSTRKDSLNKKLARVAVESARKAGAEVTYVDLIDYEMPLYDGDYEDIHGLPEAASRLRKLFIDHDGLIISTPEYNGSLPAVLKNTIDWLSRKQGDEPPLACFRGKTALLLAASPGALGGIRCLAHLNTILSGIQVMVLPEMKSVPKAHEKFDEQGNLIDKSLEQALQELTERLSTVIRSLKSSRA